MSLTVAKRPSKINQYVPYSARIIPKSIPDRQIIIQESIISEDSYWHDYYDQSDTVYEWNNGYLEKKPMSDHATSLIYNWFFNLLLLFLDTHPIATFSNLEMGFRLNKTTVRKPDLGVVLNDNPVPLLDSDMSYHGIFDLCVEALSTSNTQQKERDTITKKAEYATAGVKEYFILHNSEERAFYQLNTQGVYIPIGPNTDGVICSKVLPGFQFRISDLLVRPSEQKMLEDYVYQGFVFPAWQQDKKLCRSFEHRAQIEAARRLDAEQRMHKIEQRVQTEAALAQAEIARLKALLGL